MQNGAEADVAEVLATMPWIYPELTVVSSSDPAVAVVYSGTLGLQPINRFVLRDPFKPIQP